MKLRILYVIILLLVSSCAKDQVELSNIKESKQDLEIIAVYKEALSSLEEGDPYFSSQKFLEVELMLPQSEWAPKAALMASYSFYMYNFYAEAISNLERFLKTYPKNKNMDYAHYLIAICYYETIEDEKRDLKPLILSKEKFEYIIDNFPNTDFALDAKFKLGLIKDMLASKEMYLGRHYIKKQKWIPAINRFQNIVLNYDDTIFIEEALHRLVEIHYNIGLVDESKKYAKVLGYNYLSSDWYKKSYQILNQDYKVEIKRLTKKEKKGLLDKFKKLFD